MKWERLAAAQVSRPGLFVVVAALITAASVPLALQLGLNSQWTALLPEHAPSVDDLREAEARVGSLATVTVAIHSESKNLPAMEALARDLAERLDALPDNVVKSVDWNVSEYRDFVYAHRHLYADLADLREARDALRELLERERERANPFFVDLEDDEGPEPDEVLSQLRERMRSRLARRSAGQP